MVLERLLDKNSLFYKKAMELYESAFPDGERRPECEQMRVSQNPHYHSDIITEDEEFIGIMFYWEIDDMIFLEHFATLPSLRNHGYGSRALELLKQKGKPIILEIEDPTDELTRRRFAFYGRNGFLMNDYFHLQAKFRFGFGELMLKILSYPREVTKNEYFRFINFMNMEIGIMPKFLKDVTIRPMNNDDDVENVAGLIYIGNFYISRYMFGFFDDGVEVIKKLMDMPTIFNRENIWVAVSERGEISGILVGTSAAFAKGAAMSEEMLKKAYELAGVPYGPNAHYVFENYYSKMQNNPGGYFIASLSVDPAFRNCGIGATLLRETLKGKKNCHAECSCENVTAWRLLQRMGFGIIDEKLDLFYNHCYELVFSDKN